MRRSTLFALAAVTLLTVSACAQRKAMVPAVVGTALFDDSGYLAYLDGLPPTDPDELRMSVASIDAIEGRRVVWTPDPAEVYPYEAFHPARHFIHPDALADLLGAGVDDLALFARDAMHISGSGGGLVATDVSNPRLLHVGTFEALIFSQAPQNRLIGDIQPGRAKGVSFGIPRELLIEELQELIPKIVKRAAREGATRLVGISLSMSGGRGMRLYAFAVIEDFGPPE